MSASWRRAPLITTGKLFGATPPSLNSPGHLRYRKRKAKCGTQPVAHANLSASRGEAPHYDARRRRSLICVGGWKINAVSEGKGRAGSAVAGCARSGKVNALPVTKMNRQREPYQTGKIAHGVDKLEDLSKSLISLRSAHAVVHGPVFQSSNLRPTLPPAGLSHAKRPDLIASHRVGKLLKP